MPNILFVLIWLGMIDCKKADKGMHAFSIDSVQLCLLFQTFSIYYIVFQCFTRWRPWRTLDRVIQ